MTSHTTPPVLSAIANVPLSDTSGTVIQTAQGQFMATDTAGQTITFRVAGAAADTSRNGFTHSVVGSYGTLYYHQGTGRFEYVTNAAQVDAIAASVQATDTFTVTAVDDDDNESTARTLTVTITGINDAPTFPAPPTGLTISENSRGDDGTPVEITTVTATDVDATASLTYSLEGNPSDFAISSTGRITYTGGGLDYETRQTITLTAIVSDGTATAEVAIAIAVTNINDAPVIERSALAYNQGTQEIIIRAADLFSTDEDTADTPDQLTYTITALSSVGKLQLLDDHDNNPATPDTWEDIPAMGSFTQADVNAGKLRYVPINPQATDAASFTFTVADGGEDSVTAPNGTLNVAVREALIVTNPEQDSTVTLTGTAKIIDAGDGLDTITTGPGNDQIIGGLGSDLIHLAGGQGQTGGADELIYTFSAGSVWSARDGGDRVTGFRRGEDKIVFRVNAAETTARDLEAFLLAARGADGEALTLDDQMAGSPLFVYENDEFFVTGIAFYFRSGGSYSDGKLAMGVLDIEFANRLPWDDFMSLIEIENQDGTTDVNLDYGLLVIEDLTVLPRVFGADSLEFRPIFLTVTGADSAIEDSREPVEGQIAIAGTGYSLSVTRTTGTPATTATAIATTGETSVAGTYGTLHVAADGTWRYVLDNANSNVNALDAGERLTETFDFTYSNAEAASQSNTLAITINGRTDHRITNNIFTSRTSVTEDTAISVDWRVLDRTGDDTDTDTDIFELTGGASTNIRATAAGATRASFNFDFGGNRGWTVTAVEGGPAGNNIRVDFLGRNFPRFQGLDGTGTETDPYIIKIYLDVFSASLDTLIRAVNENVGHLARASLNPGTSDRDRTQVSDYDSRWGSGPISLRGGENHDGFHTVNIAAGTITADDTTISFSAVNDLRVHAGSSVIVAETTAGNNMWAVRAVTAAQRTALDTADTTYYVLGMASASVYVPNTQAGDSQGTLDATGDNTDTDTRSFTFTGAVVSDIQLQAGYQTIDIAAGTITSDGTTISFSAANDLRVNTGASIIVVETTAGNGMWEVQAVNAAQRTALDNADTAYYVLGTASTSIYTPNKQASDGSGFLDATGDNTDTDIRTFALAGAEISDIQLQAGYQTIDIAAGTITTGGTTISFSAVNDLRVDTGSSAIVAETTAGNGMWQVQAATATEIAALDTANTAYYVLGTASADAYTPNQIIRSSQGFLDATGDNTDTDTRSFALAGAEISDIQYTKIVTGIQASVSVGLGSNRQARFTADTAGADGNFIRVQIVSSGFIDDIRIGLSGSGTADSFYNIRVEVSSGNLAIRTVSHVINAINGNTAVSALITASTIGSRAGEFGLFNLENRTFTLSDGRDAIPGYDIIDIAAGTIALPDGTLINFSAADDLRVDTGSSAIVAETTAGNGMWQVQAASATEIAALDTANTAYYVLGTKTGNDAFVANSEAGVGTFYITVVTGSGNDIIVPDTSTTENNNENIFAGAGHDEVYGGGGNDIIRGEAGNDFLNGEAGDDILIGGTGHDRLSGGLGRDIVTGGTGNDIFDLQTLIATATSNADIDIVTDFGTGDNQIRVEVAGAVETLAALPNVRMTNNTDYSAISGIMVAGTNDANIHDTIIWHTNGTADNMADDFVLMVLEDYNTTLTLADFDIV